MRFSQYLDFFAPSDSRFSNSCISAKYCPIKPYINGKLIYSAFRWCINLNFTKLTLMTGFVVQGHVNMFYKVWQPDGVQIFFFPLIYVANLFFCEIFSLKGVQYFFKINAIWFYILLSNDLHTFLNIRVQIFCGAYNVNKLFGHLSLYNLKTFSVQM